MDVQGAIPTDGEVQNRTYRLAKERVVGIIRRGLAVDSGDTVAGLEARGLAGAAEMCIRDSGMCGAI